MGSSDELKSEALLEQMKRHLNTDEGKAIVKKIGLVYQINIAPKVNHRSLPESHLSLYEFKLELKLKLNRSQKLGINEVAYTIDLKKGEFKKG